MAAGRKHKQKKIKELNTFSNVFQCYEFLNPVLQDKDNKQVDYVGKWSEGFFKNSNPITVELACGKGDYTVALAAKYPDRNFIGIDIKGPRLHTGAKQAAGQGLTNVAFVRIKIENIIHFFAPGEIDEIWITFPDPFPKDSHEKHRLTHMRFLDKYKVVLKEGGIIQLKTDAIDLFRFTRTVIEDNKLNMLYYREDIYAQPLDFHELETKTFYEKQFLAIGKSINYLRFTL
jgi:tRNA (guanine-N7-)-methyltransferase